MNNQQSAVFDAAGYSDITLTLECSKAATVVVEVGNGAAWAGTESEDCTHPGRIIQIPVHGAYYRLLLWTAEGTVVTTAIAQFDS